MLKMAKIPISSIPAHLPALKAFAKNQGHGDAPKAMAEVRHRLTHPKVLDDVYDRDGLLTEAWFLTIRYLGLLFLHWVGYTWASSIEPSGGGRRWPQVDAVPWAPRRDQARQPVNHVSRGPGMFRFRSNGMVIRRLLSWTFDRPAVPLTFRPRPRIESHRAARADVSGLVNLGPASRPDERLSLHTAEATGSKPVTPTHRFRTHGVGLCQGA
jgi:hypothetical protein